MFEYTEGSEVFKTEVSSALDKMNRNKGVESDVIVREMLSALCNFISDKITIVIIEVYNSGSIPPMQIST